MTALGADVVIVGAGPAGALAAATLAPSRRTLLVDRGRRRVARMVECLPGAARRPLADAGLLGAFSQHGHDRCYVKRSRWEHACEREVDGLADPDGPGWLVDRGELDDWLRAAAVARGAVLVAPAEVVAVELVAGGWRLQLRGPDGCVDVSAGALIDAGGRVAPLATRLGAVRRRSDRLVAGLLYGVDRCGSAGAGSTYVEATADGWWYTAAARGVRVVAFHTDADLPAAAIARSGAALWGAMAGVPALADLLGPGEAFDFAFTAAHSSVLSPCAGDGWSAAGDAAVSFDPVSSQGVLNAFITGMAAAASVDDSSDYAAMVASVHEAYLGHRDGCYGVVQRWPDAPFWRRRSAGAIRAADGPGRRSAWPVS